MHGIVDNDPYDVMDLIRLVPQLVFVSAAAQDVISKRESYPLNARVQAVQSSISREARARGSSIILSIVDREHRPMRLDEPLALALARNHNELHITAVPGSQSEPNGEDSTGDSYVLDTDPCLVFERLAPSVLDGEPLDLSREVGERLFAMFPQLKFELRDMWNSSLSDQHTNRYYITGPPSYVAAEPFFMLIPKEHASKTLEIDIAPGIRLELDSQCYSFDAQDALVISHRAVEALRQFSRSDEAVSLEMLEPLLQTLPASARLNAASMRGQQLADLLAAEYHKLQERLIVGSALRAGPAPPPQGFLGVNAPVFARPRFRANLRRPLAALWTDRTQRIVLKTLRTVKFLAVAIQKAALWLYANNIAGLLIYAIGTTLLSYSLDKENHIAIYLLWGYAFTAILVVVLQIAAGVNLIETIVRRGYPAVYPLGETPADVLPAVPATSIRAAVEGLSRDEPVDYDLIVKDMMIKPSWFQIVAVCVTSLDPVLFKEWSRQVRKRRSLAYDAVRLAITKQQQIGL